MKDKFLTITAFALLAFWIVDTSTQYIATDYRAIFWFCNFSIPLLAIAFFERSTKAVYLFVALALVVQTPWIIDWISEVATGHGILGLFNFYAQVPIFSKILSFIQHIVLLPISIVALVSLKPVPVTKKLIAIIWLTVFATLVISLLLPIEQNINCAHSSCLPFNETSGFGYTITWGTTISVLAMFLLIALVAPLHHKIRKK